MSTIDQEAMVYAIERLAGPKTPGALAALLEHSGTDWPAYLGVQEDAITGCLTSYWEIAVDEFIKDVRRNKGAISQDAVSLMRPWCDTDDGARLWASERATQTWAIYRDPSTNPRQEAS